jgi:ATP-dependent DNA helicase RecG
MTLSLDSTRLRQIIEQEKKLGYTNKSVFGGLDLFLANWFGQTIPQISQPNRLKALQRLHPPTFNYGAMSQEKREEWIDSILAFLAQQDNTTPTIEKAASTAKKASFTHKPSPPPAESAVSVDSLITVIKGIAAAISDRFAKLGVHTIRDLLYFFPNRHLDYSHLQIVSQLKEGNEQTIMANVWEVRLTMPGGRRSTEATLGDESGNVRAVWFNNPYIARQMKSGGRIVMSGRVKIFAGRPVFESPEWELAEDKELVHTGRLVPLYPLTSGLHQRQVRKIVKTVVDDWAGKLPEFMPVNIIRQLTLLGLNEAVSQAHFPDDALLKDRARVRLAFDELFLLQLGVMAKKRKWQTEQPGVSFNIDNNLLDRFYKSLPFTLTPAQKRVLTEIMFDLTRPVAMSRLLQGEVGSGKTVVALAALLMAVADGYQGALMAPTEILAEQHFTSVCRMLAGVGKVENKDESLCGFTGIMGKPLTVALLISDLKGAAKRELKTKLASGEADIAIGTHALIQKEVKFKKLGLAVVDEQHRFGVEQRSALRQKGFNPHMLVMTATPIPRTLALTLYGDLDLSVIDELPPGRQEIKTKWFSPAQRESAYKFLHKQVSEGHQAFIICPLVEESDSVQAKAAVAEYERLSNQIFPDLRLALLHGRMSATQKDEVMGAFNRHECDVLVSTPVVEVGIDVPNATVTMIESADRFGLSQLHQFRGRVGRGAAQSYCMLMAENPSDIGRLRLDIIETTQDGFKLADEDLKLRGPGEFFGTRQSGLPDLRMAKLSDTALLELARNEAVNLFETDADLKATEHRALARELTRVWGQKSGEWS